MYHPRFGLSACSLMGALVCTFMLVAGCGPAEELEGVKGQEALGKQRNQVVYGTDDRQDVYAHPDAMLRARARQSTVALVRAADINAANPNDVTLASQTLGNSYALCATERFREDPTAAFCSGTLIDDDLVLTAGHCVTTATDCANTRLVFNYYRTGAHTLRAISTADIFGCAAIVARQQGLVGTRNLDYAILRLDRAATPRFIPAPVRPGNSALADGQNVAVIGSGSGIPFKIDSGGSVRDGRAGTLDYFVATTDTFGGNSGSGVYELTHYSVAGILVRGESDYVYNGSCSEVNVCDETVCRGEDVTYVSPAIHDFCEVTHNGSFRLCSGLPPPPPPNTYTFSASNTDSAMQNTINRSVTLAAGQVIQLGTCSLAGASGTGDTYLRLYNPRGLLVASNDDSRGLLSYLGYTVPAGAGGTYQVRAGCFSNSSCSGTVVYNIQ